MAWLADLAGKAENLLNNIDTQTGVALRSHNVNKSKRDKSEFTLHTNLPAWNQKPQPLNGPRSARKSSPPTETRSNFSTRKSAPPLRQIKPLMKNNTERAKERLPVAKASRSPPRKATTPQNNTPETLVGDVKYNNDIVHFDQFGLKHRRFSLPADLEIINDSGYTYKMQNLEVENAMLKNELNVMNREVSELLDKLRITEDGNDIVSDKDLNEAQAKLENCELLNHKVHVDKESLIAQMELLKKRVTEISTVEISKYMQQTKNLELEASSLRERNKSLEELAQQINNRLNEKDAIHKKLENELRHAQTNVKDLEGNLEKSTAECRRLEKDWETYKHRVKSMLFTKDKEIKALQEGMNLTEDTKILIEQIETLREEREDLSESVARCRGECESMRLYVSQLEGRHENAERVVTALRDALKDERTSKNRAEAQCGALGKELKNMQLEMSHQVASLRSAMHDKEKEMARLKESSSVLSSGTSGLNVADYDDRDIDNEKVHYLTQTLVQRQGKIDSLLAEINMLKIQMDKSESKYKAEITNLRAQNAHSIIHLHEDHRSRRSKASSDDTLSNISLRIGVMLKRYPIIRIFIICYMIGLHFWVLTVLLTSTPEGYGGKPSKIHPQ